VPIQSGNILKNYIARQNSDARNAGRHPNIGTPKCLPSNDRRRFCLRGELLCWRLGGEAARLCRSAAQCYCASIDKAQVGGALRQEPALSQNCQDVRISSRGNIRVLTSACERCKRGCVFTGNGLCHGLVTSDRRRKRRDRVSVSSEWAYHGVGWRRTNYGCAPRHPRWGEVRNLRAGGTMQFQAPNTRS